MGKEREANGKRSKGQPATSVPGTWWPGPRAGQTPGNCPSNQASLRCQAGLRGREPRRQPVGIKRLTESLGWLTQARSGLRFISQSHSAGPGPGDLPSRCDQGLPSHQPRKPEPTRAVLALEAPCLVSISPLHSLPDDFCHMPQGGRTYLTSRTLTPPRTGEEQDPDGGRSAAQAEGVHPTASS